MSTPQTLLPPASPSQHRYKKLLVVTDQPKFDLETYLSNYRGRTILERLLHIGVCSTVLGVEALKTAVQEAKKGQDVKRYLEAQTHLETLRPNEPEARRDNVWIERTNGKNRAETARLEAELKQYKNNLIKESIRMGNEDLGKHFLAIGNLTKAYEAFSRMRQEVSITKHIVDFSKHLIEVAIEQRNWIAVVSNVQKIRAVVGSTEQDKTLQPFLCAAEGLSHLDNEEYYLAANSFLCAESGIGLSCNNIMTPNDIAIYGGLCALATMDRNQLQRQVLENSIFRSSLELEPHIRRAINFFVNSRYSACLNILEAYRPDYLLDIHLQSHVDEIYQLIRSKSIVQYFIPFSCVTLDSLNATFAPPGKTVEKELVLMIQRKELNARIDTQNRLLTALPHTPRHALQASILQTVKSYESEARLRLQHMNICSVELDLKGKPQNNNPMSYHLDDAYGDRNLRRKNVPDIF